MPLSFENEDDEGHEIYSVFVYEIDEEDWRQPFVDYLKDGKFPDDPQR
jgi:hypothetical protein